MASSSSCADGGYASGLAADGLPMSYLQLDDWWYQGRFFFGNVKAVTGVGGRACG